MRILAKSPRAQEARRLVERLQLHFVEGLDEISRHFGQGVGAQSVEWLRDNGRCGGGMRYELHDAEVYNRGSVNISQVHYEAIEEKALNSATAISTIIHPDNPYAPSIHLHISYTEYKKGDGYWRLMVDLNPSNATEWSKARFEEALAEASGALLEEGKRQGDRYFYIPALGRTRGVSHFYLESYNEDSFEAQLAFADRFGHTMIDAYLEILRHSLERYADRKEEKTARDKQLAYHTLYLFQVLTLDRGTVAGLLVHDENDVGIMGSLPSHVDRDLLASWEDRMPSPQEKLLRAIVDALPEQSPSPVSVEVKKRLAQAVREHYRNYPEALSLQASGDIVPPTVDNHLK